MFPQVVSRIIAEYSAEYVLCEQLTNLMISRRIDPLDGSYFDRFIWFLTNPKEGLSHNTHPAAVDYLLRNVDHINYVNLCKNTNDRAVDYMLSPDKSGWVCVSILLNKNPRAVKYILDGGLNSISNSHIISANPHPKIVRLLAKEIQKGEIRFISWSWMSANTNPDATRLLLGEVEKGRASINWRRLSENPNPVAVGLILEQLDLEPAMLAQNWIHLLRNSNPQIVELIKKRSLRYTDYELFALAENSGAIDLICEYLMANPRRLIPWNGFSANPAIFADTSDEIYGVLKLL